DGQPFTANDVLFTYHVLQDVEYQQPGAEFWRDVGIAAGGPGQVVFSLKAPSASFPLALQIGIIPRHIYVGMAPAQIAASPYSSLRAFGTGPFRVSAISNLAITLDRNPYANPQPYLDHLVLRTYPATDPQQAIRAVLSGAADLVGGLEPQEVDALQGRTDLTVLDAHLFTNAFVAMNPDGPGKQFFSDVRVRLAFTQAVDRQRLIDQVLSSKADPDPTPIPTAEWAHSAAAAGLHPYDPLAAAKGLDAAGWTQQPGAKLRSRSGTDLKVGLVVADSYPNRQVADALAQQLLLIGVEVDVKAVPASQLVQSYLIGHNYQMALAAFDVGADPDLYSLWHSGADPSALNFAYTRGWGVIDKDLEDGRAELDTATRLASYIDFQMLMADAAPAIFLYSGRYDYAVSQRVHGVRIDKAIEPPDRFRYVTDWYVNTT
ncbi:MAG TPA: ABC transporter substrate-binding protein, partial [Candidatus Dormibacteraeota bacterium]|nr:ABC transporter substrate-binding protein [Candidatus Dormibacteraeota bacterium]